jgi:hypothetical protein
MRGFYHHAVALPGDGEQQDAKICKRDAVDARHRLDRQSTANGTIEHPYWNLEQSLRRLGRQATSAYPSPGAHEFLVNVDFAPRPWMPVVMEFPDFRPVSVVMLRCTIRGALTRHWTTGRRWRYGGPARRVRLARRLWI